MTRKMQEMTWMDFEKIKDSSIVIIPVGSTEQHGPHLPLSTDVIISTKLSEMIAEKVNGIVAPSIIYGYKSAPLSGGGSLFPGTLDLKGTTFMYLMNDVIEELISDGVRKIVVLNGHYENEAFILETVDNISKKNQDVQIIEASWWNHISDDVMGKVFDEIKFPGWEVEHAAMTETSMMLKFSPELVHMDRLKEDVVRSIQAHHVYPVSKNRVHYSGMLASCKGSSAEKGELLADEIVSDLSIIITQELK